MAELDYNILRQKPDESKVAHHKRLVYGKLVDKTLADYDYTELSLYVYGKEYSPDVSRRMLYGSKRTLDLIEQEKENGIQDAGILSELEEKRRALQEERQRFYDQRREYGKLVTKDSRKQHLYEALINAADELADTVGCLYPPMFERSPAPSKCGAEAVLVLSDWHFGLVTENVFNSYDTSICKQRVTQVADMAMQRILLHGCRKLHVVVLGDLIHGAIHTSARVASEELVCDQIMQASEILAQTILYLSKYMDETFVYCTYGNHARTVQNKKDNLHADNMERLIPWWLKERFKNNDFITVNEDAVDEFLLFDVCGHSICASHGDLDNVKTASRTLYTLMHRQLGKSIEYIILGDKHHRESFEELGVYAELCGSLCGTDDYANDKRLYSSPSQLLWIMTPENGVDAQYHLRVRN